MYISRAPCPIGETASARPTYGALPDNICTPPIESDSAIAVGPLPRLGLRHPVSLIIGTVALAERWEVGKVELATGKEARVGRVWTWR